MNPLVFEGYLYGKGVVKIDVTEDVRILNEIRHPRAIRNAQYNAPKLILTWKSPAGEEFSKLLALVKKIPGRGYLASKKLWTIPAKDEYIEILQELGFKIEGVPSIVKAEITEALPWLTYPLNTDGFETLYPYQLDFIRMMLWRMDQGLSAGLNADDMGTGKTCQSISFYRYIQKWPILVVTTATTKMQWASQVKQWAPGRKTAILSGKTPYPIKKSVDVVIINWEVLWDWRMELSRHGFEGVIGDEIHYISSGDARRTKAFKLIAKRVPIKIGLSGTPMKTKPKQFFTVLNLIDPIQFPDREQFHNRYCGPRHNGFGMTYDGSSNEAELHQKVRLLMVRRLKSDVAKQLPEKIRSPIPIPVPEKDYELQEDLFLSNIEGTRDHELQQIANLSKTIFDLKVKGIMAWISDFLESGRKLVIFGWHRSVLNYLEHELGSACVKIIGGTKDAERQAAIKKFTTSKSCRILIGNISSMGTGVDGLQHVCTDVAFVEFVASPGDIAQAEDRLYRIGQTEPVTCHYLYGANTVEEATLKVLESRWTGISSIMDGHSAEPANLVSEIKAIRKKQRKASREKTED